MLCEIAFDLYQKYVAKTTAKVFNSKIEFDLDLNWPKKGGSCVSDVEIRFFLFLELSPV